jgi:uncharacterized protein (UPF0248 family)
MAKRTLDEMKWHPEKGLHGVEVTYLHRGAPGDRMIVLAEDILRLEKSFFIIEGREGETYIPYHRILEIRQNDKILWKYTK